jgi:hypothetical protein
MEKKIKVVFQRVVYNQYLFVVERERDIQILMPQLVIP